MQKTKEEKTHTKKKKRKNLQYVNISVFIIYSYIYTPLHIFNNVPNPITEYQYNIKKQMNK